MSWTGRVVSSRCTMSLIPTNRINPFVFKIIAAEPLSTGPVSPCGLPVSRPAANHVKLPVSLDQPSVAELVSWDPAGDQSMGDYSPSEFSSTQPICGQSVKDILPPRPIPHTAAVGVPPISKLFIGLSLGGPGDNVLRRDPTPADANVYMPPESSVVGDTLPVHLPGVDSGPDPTALGMGPAAAVPADNHVSSDCVPTDTHSDIPTNQTISKAPGQTPHAGNIAIGTGLRSNHVWKRSIYFPPGIRCENKVLLGLGHQEIASNKVLRCSSSHLQRNRHHSMPD